MDFFERQDVARKKTRWLILYFIAAVTLITVMMYFVAMLAYAYTSLNHHHRYYDDPSQVFTWWNPQVFLAATIGTLAVIFTGSLWKTMELSGGGGALAESMGGTLIASNTTDLDERKLLNVVEEMSIASGVPMPQVYVMDSEDGINAFASGHKPGDAAICVTENCMKKLSRDELQGVIGHEFSHILNGDMKLNLRLIGILFGILCIATIGRILMQMRSGSSRDRNPLPILGLLLLVIGSIGVFFGRLIQSAISRQREFLADASSVQFTRNPLGLSGALQKVGGYTSLVMSPHAPDAAHMFFGDVNGTQFFDSMATHPPLEQRIKAIDPSWNGKFQRVPDEKRDEVYRRETAPPAQNIFGTVLGGTILASGGMDAPPVVKSRHVMPNIGNPTPLHLKYAENLHASLPENVKAASREPLAAVALIYAMVLSPDETVRATQLTELAKRVIPAICDKTDALFPDVSKIAAQAHLPIINLAIGGLRQLSADQFQNFSQTLQWLIESDGKVELFEFVLQKIILRHLDSQFNGPQKAVVQYYTITPLVPDCAVVLSALANVGHDDAAAISKAFEAGAPYLRAPNDNVLQLLPREQCGVNEIDAALNRLAGAVPIIKKNLVEACIHVVGADGVIVADEAELLRAISDTLDCPMPPFLESSAN